MSHSYLLHSVPAIIYIDKWGRRPMLLIGTLLMGFWMYLVGGLQGRFGHWGTTEGSSSPVWVIDNNQAATKAVIVCSYLFVCRCVALFPRRRLSGINIFISFAVTMGPVSWTYPAEIVSGAF